MRHLPTLRVLMAIFALGIAAPASAVSGRGAATASAHQSEATATVNDHAAAAKERQTAVKEKACERVQSTLETRLSNQNKVRDNRTAVYQRIADRLRALATTLKTEGADTTQLQMDLDEFDSRIAAFTSAYDDFIAALAATTPRPCGVTTTELRDQVASLREKFAGVREAAQNVRTFWRDALRPEIRDLRQSIDKTTDSSSTKSEAQ